ncbi:hypothetical protein TREMEDRAFT_68343 [Tremella mesenterica DSM 1558]|uniref:uncharacterized protein n=1 Tax=Tremella mesenterica (strain ATCC 24925 / CBS 8224 / DSM 1558 / NBRC 9311 / NRRL Y-6157 / RJB 2259-6 / UBC 559-6) TaxID=578456 RepID=UPI0003F49E45|nr:uncharacterized protein TREMEDRAFT_68343 [Tremella mesenterica DSM 1558]EIW69877.1 hypothetical protein TREMEDRAFT_68343 [Tremella mesenterica DSM 1558]
MQPHDHSPSPPASPGSSDSSSLSGTETTLPTPHMAESMYQDDMSPALPPSPSIKTDIFSPISIPPAPLPPNGLEIPVSPTTIPSISVHPVNPTSPQVQESPSPSPYPSRRSSTTPTRHPPPPISILSTPSDHRSHGLFPVDTRSSSGLAITGLVDHQSSIEQAFDNDTISAAEAGDALPEMTPSPGRLAFRTTDHNGNPVSPAPWHGFDIPSPGPRRSTQHFHPLPSPLPTKTRHGSVNDKTMFEPTPMHGLHARNLSLFFPQPGKAPVPQTEGNGHTLIASPEQAGESLIPDATGLSRDRFGGQGGWSFGQGAAGPLLVSPDVKHSKRRGHHHKHSLSHNFFSFLDPTVTNPALAQSSSTPSVSTVSPAHDRPQPVPMPLLHTTATSNSTLSPLPPSKRDHHAHLLFSFALLEFLIGAGLWVEGQMSGWRCLAGVGYLVVFDALGVAIRMVRDGEEGWRSVRKPYGNARLTSLLYFAQSLFLAFAAVYIAKEAIEQVLLGAGAHDHGIGGGHGHGEVVGHDEQRGFPHFLLACAASSSVLSASVFGNHARLVDAVGPVFLPPAYLQSVVVMKFRSLLGNPFSLTVVGTSVGILLGSLVVPQSNIHSLDSSLALFLAILTAALSYPLTITFGHILLQTAPLSSSAQMVALRQSLREISDDRRVLALGTMRCWQISAGLRSSEILKQSQRHDDTYQSASRRGSVEGLSSGQMSPTRKTSSSRFSIESKELGIGGVGGFGGKDEGGPVVVTLIVHVQEDVSDRDMLEVTKMAWRKVTYAVGEGRGAGGEVSIQIRRGWQGE